MKTYTKLYREAQHESPSSVLLMNATADCFLPFPPIQGVPGDAGAPGPAGSRVSIWLSEGNFSIHSDSDLLLLVIPRFPVPHGLFPFSFAPS